MVDRAMDKWLPGYVGSIPSRAAGRRARRTRTTHVVFLVCDHFEPRHRVSDDAQAYERIATDAIARFKRLDGHDVLFITGMDEYGLKVQQTSARDGVTPQEFVDKVAADFATLGELLDAPTDDFVRTTQPRHAAAVTELWKRMQANGDIYLSKYAGWYSVRDEAYFDEGELTTNAEGRKFAPTGSPVEWMEEENYLFRLSAYADRLLAHYEANPDFVTPETYRNEIVAFVKRGLEDLSISRTNFNWGVPVPGSPGHVMYVWVDALTTYLSGIGFPEKQGEFSRFWPANVHIIGKDIVRFHAVYWPAFLMSAGLPLPLQIFGHGFLLNRGEKMSKSLGNVVDPIELADRFGVDALRYFLMREVSFGQDGTYSAEAIVTRVNADLANSFGNLAQRVLSFISKNLDGRLPQNDVKTAEDGELLALVDDACRNDVPREFAAFAFSQGLESWMRAVFACNQYVDAQAPWALRKTDPQRMEAVLETLLRAMRALAIAVQPVIPVSAAKLLDQLGIEAQGRDYAALIDHDYYARLASKGTVIAPPTPIFPRLELPVDA
jgi:methionyl-tRNA synthetase